MTPDQENAILAILNLLPEVKRICDEQENPLIFIESKIAPAIIAATDAIKAIEDEMLKSCIRGVEEFSSKADKKLRLVMDELLRLSLAESEKDRRFDDDRNYWMAEMIAGFRLFNKCQIALKNATEVAWVLGMTVESQ